MVIKRLQEDVLQDTSGKMLTCTMYMYTSYADVAEEDDPDDEHAFSCYICCSKQRRRKAQNARTEDHFH